MLGVILGSINFLPSHEGKEGSGLSIVIGTAGLRKKLETPVHAKLFRDVEVTREVYPGYAKAESRTGHCENYAANFVSAVTLLLG